MGVIDTLRQKALEYGIPFEIVYSIVGTETGGTFDPSVVGDQGKSFGLFQIHTPAHPNFDVSRYTDPAYQADYQLPELKKIYDQGYKKGYRGVELAKYVQVYGQRPAYNDPNVKGYIDKAIPQYYNTAVGGGLMAEPKSLNDTSFDFWGLLKVPESIQGQVETGSKFVLLLVLYLGIGILFFVAIYQIAK